MEIFVGNLPFDISEQDIREKFAEYGEVSNVKMLFDKMSGRFRGIAFVSFEDEAQARAALEALNGAEIGGRPMRLDFSRGVERRFTGFGGGFAPRKKFFRNDNRDFRQNENGFRADRRCDGDFRERRDDLSGFGDGENAPRKPFFKKRPFRPFGGFKRRDNFERNDSFENRAEDVENGDEFERREDFRPNRGGFKPKFGGYKGGFKRDGDFRGRGNFQGKPRGGFRRDFREDRNGDGRDFGGRGNSFRSRDDFGDE